MRGDDEYDKVPRQKREKRTGWRLVANGGYDHQFFDSNVLDKLEAKEIAWKEYCKRCEEDPTEADKSPPEQFSYIDAQELKKLLSEGWATWNNKDFHAFIEMAAKYGRDKS